MPYSNMSTSINLGPYRLPGLPPRLVLHLLGPSQEARRRKASPYLQDAVEKVRLFSVPQGAVS